MNKNQILDIINLPILNISSFLKREDFKQYENDVEFLKTCLNHNERVSEIIIDLVLDNDELFDCAGDLDAIDFDALFKDKSLNEVNKKLIKKYDQVLYRIYKKDLISWEILFYVKQIYKKWTLEDLSIVENNNLWNDFYNYINNLEGGSGLKLLNSIFSGEIDVSNKTYNRLYKKVKESFPAIKKVNLPKEITVDELDDDEREYLNEKLEAHLTLPEKELEFLNWLKKDYKEKNANSFAERFFNVGQFFEDPEMTSYFYSGWIADELDEEYSEDTGNGVMSTEVIKNCIPLFDFMYYSGSDVLVYFNKAYYVLSSEGEVFHFADYLYEVPLSIYEKELEEMNPFGNNAVLSQNWNEYLEFCANKGWAINTDLFSDSVKENKLFTMRFFINDFYKDNDVFIKGLIPEYNGFKFKEVNLSLKDAIKRYDLISLINPGVDGVLFTHEITFKDYKFFATSDGRIFKEINDKIVPFSRNLMYVFEYLNMIGDFDLNFGDFSTKFDYNSLSEYGYVSGSFTILYFAEDVSEDEEYRSDIQVQIDYLWNALIRNKIEKL